jgi:hypothetical protein
MDPNNKNATTNDLDAILLIGRMDGKIDLLLEYRKDQDVKITRIDSRVASLESWRSKTIGVLAAMSGLSVALSHMDLQRFITIFK